MTQPAEKPPTWAWFAGAAVIVIFVGVMQLFAFVPKIFFPPNDRPTLLAEFWLPTGTPLVRSEEIVLEAQDDDAVVLRHQRHLAEDDVADLVAFDESGEGVGQLEGLAAPLEGLWRQKHGAAEPQQTNE